MTTDLTGDFELQEDEFDWDVFLPDPDEAEIVAEAAALEDEAELNIDDSDFDWEAGLREESGTENDADTGARAGAAYDRIVDTVRRSTEEPEAEGPEEAVVSEPVAVLHTETPVTAEPEPVVVPPATAFDAVEEPDMAVDHALLHEPDIDIEPDEPAGAAGLSSEATWGTEAERESAPLFVAESDPAADVASEPSVMPEFEPDFEEEPAPARFVAAAVGVEELEELEQLEELESAPTVSIAPEPAWAMAPAQPWEVDEASEPEPEPAPLDPRLEDGSEGERKGRSRVFTATVVLACLFLVIVAAAVTVRSLRHSTTTPPAAVHSTPPASASPGTASSASTSAGTARIQAATDAVDSATTAASVGLTSLNAFPTPTNVETVINPYISSLQLFQTFLSGARVPASAKATATSAEAQLRQDLQFLDTIDGLPPQQLGAYLTQFDTDATQLQTTLSTLEQNLRSSAS